MTFFLTRPLSIDPKEVVRGEVEVRTFEHVRVPTRDEIARGARGCSGGSGSSDIDAVTDNGLSGGHRCARQRKCGAETQ